MIPSPRLPRLRRSTLVLVVAIAALAFPLGVLANHQFSDVPTGASYHDDVEALVDAGVTTGCGGGEYCPSDSVTRGQMAQFLNRLGSLDGNTPPSVDANSVDGYDANELTRAALGAMSSAALTANYQTIGSVTITAPAAGFVILNGASTTYSFDAGCGCEVTIGLSDVTNDFPDAWSNARVGSGAASTQIATIAIPHVYPVGAGTHTFYLVAVNHGAASGLASVTFGNLVAQFTPFGSTGGSTLGLTDAPAAPSTTSVGGE